MKSKQLIRLGAVAAVALIGALWIGAKREPETSLNGAHLLAPGLKDSLNQIKTVRLIGAESKPIATLAKSEQGWNVAERSGFEADSAKVRELLLKLADATLVEAKTTKPELYKKLGVEDLSAKDATGVQVEIEGGKAPLKLIVGRFNGQGGDGTFVRRAGEPQAWLAKGSLAVDKNTGDWLERDLADIPSSRLSSAEIVAGGKTLKAFKTAETDTSFKIADVPKGREPSSEFAANGLGSVLAGLRFDDVKPAAEAAPPADAHSVRYVSFDGLTVDGKAWEAQSKDYAQFQASFDETQAKAAVERMQAKEIADYEAKAALAAKAPEAAKPTDAAKPAAATPPVAANAPAPPLAVTDKAKDAEAKLAKLRQETDDLKTRFEGWTFVIPAFKYANINRTMDDLLKPLETKADKAKKPTPLIPK